jgi:hypothetical protein
MRFDRSSLLKQVVHNVANADLLKLSYLATKGWGFREVRNLSDVLGDDRPLSMSDLYPDRKFGNRFGFTEERRIDITSLHVALTPEICQIHIDDVGFVLRGPRGLYGMSPDFLQHLLNELVLKTYVLPNVSPWLADHLPIILPGSDNRYLPTAGLKLDLPDQGATITASFTYGCNCVPGGRAKVEDAIVPMPRGGWSVGGGLTLKTNFLGGGGPPVHRRK